MSSNTDIEGVFSDILHFSFVRWLCERRNGGGYHHWAALHFGYRGHSTEHKWIESNRPGAFIVFETSFPHVDTHVCSPIVCVTGKQQIWHIRLGITRDPTRECYHDIWITLQYYGYFVIFIGLWYIFLSLFSPSKSCKSNIFAVLTHLRQWALSAIYWTK